MPWAISWLQLQKYRSKVQLHWRGPKSNRRVNFRDKGTSSRVADAIVVEMSHPRPPALMSSFVNDDGVRRRFLLAQIRRHADQSALSLTFELAIWERTNFNEYLEPLYWKIVFFLPELLATFASTHNWLKIALCLGPSKSDRSVTSRSKISCYKTNSKNTLRPTPGQWNDK